MIAECPACARRWMLPEERIGPGGAVVRCAACETEFEWFPFRNGPRADDRIAESPAVTSGAPIPYGSGAASAIAELDDADATPAMVARMAVEELALSGGETMLRAWDEGRLFERCGPLIVRAWDRCRERLGPGAEVSVFRDALRARFGIDLPEWREP